MSETHPPIGDFAGQLAVVTGAASGIGAACVRAMASQGTVVMGIDLLDPEDDRWHANAAARLCCNVSVEAEGNVLSAEVRRRGGADVLVNCAGGGSTTDTVGTDSDTWDRVFAVKSRGTFPTRCALLPQMIASGRGSIVNIASVAGPVGLRDRADYCDSKDAVMVLTRAIAVDHVWQGVRSNAASPGTVDSPWAHRLVEEVGISLDGLPARQPMGRLGTADEIAATVAFLVGPRSSFTTGAVNTVDGELSAA